MKSPRLVKAQAESLAAGLPRLLLAAERLAHLAAAGRHSRRRAGPGEAFWQFRQWQTGDDTRRIDWRRSAMGSRLYLREQEWEAQTGLSLTLHDTPSMAFRGVKTLPAKRERALLLLLALAALLLRAGERVALTGITPLIAGPRALNDLAAALATGGGAPVDQRARRVEFGDFLLPEPRFSAPPGGAVMQILDPAECDFPYSGRIVFEDFNTEPALEASRAESWTTAYRARIAAQREMVAQAASQAGQTALFHRTDAAPAVALSALYQALRKQ